MNEEILLKRFILNSKATNQEHIEAINWVNSLVRKAKQQEQTEEQKPTLDGK